VQGDGESRWAPLIDLFKQRGDALSSVHHRLLCERLRESR
jgi:hypothetical protein